MDSYNDVPVNHSMYNRNMNSYNDVPVNHGMYNRNNGGIPVNHSMYNRNINSYNDMDNYNNTELVEEKYQNPYYSIPNNSPYSCLDVSGHIENCPICSKFYNNDKSVYIISIIILLIISIILLKKVLEK